jgi:hypothetical protein
MLVCTGGEGIYLVVEGTRVLLGLVADESRSVREQVYWSLKRFGGTGVGKRERGVEGVEGLFDGIDFEELREKSVAEGLYDEVLVFEVDSSLVRCDGMDENNVLACYDC